MSDNPYSFHRRESTDILGRKKFLEKMVRHLTKETPQHISLIGPREMGKSVLLRHLAHQLSEAAEPYEFVIYWNLAHGTPRNDEEFFRQLHDQIKLCIKDEDADLAEWFNEDAPRDALNGLFEELVSAERKLLIILDNLDAPLSRGSLTRDSLDWLRSLNDNESAVLVTGSRLTLLDLCKSEENESSPLWNIFHKEKLGTWEQTEWDDVLTPLIESGCTVHKSAREALQAWTNGIPALTTLVLSQLFETHKEKEIHGADVDSLCDSLARPDTEIVKCLWDDCEPDWQSDLVQLSKGPTTVNSFTKPSRDALCDRGLARVKSGQVEGICKFMTEFAQHSGSEVEHLNRLFADQESYRENIRQVLEKRVDQIEGSDKKLKSYISSALNNLALEPEVAVQGIRGVANRAMALVFDKECPNGVIDQNWLNKWKMNGESLSRHMEVERGTVPKAGGPRRDLIHLMSRDSRDNKVAEYISRPTALLIDFIQRTGDFGNHIEDEEVSFEFAVSVVSSAIELCDHLARELA